MYILFNSTGSQTVYKVEQPTHKQEQLIAYVQTYKINQLKKVHS